METLRDRGWMEVLGGIAMCDGFGGAHRAYCFAERCLSAGTWGSGWAFKKSVREGVSLETVVFKTYAMVMVWRLGPQGRMPMAWHFWSAIWGRLWRSLSKLPLKRGTGGSIP